MTKFLQSACDDDDNVNDISLYMIEDDVGLVGMMAVVNDAGAQNHLLIALGIFNSPPNSPYQYLHIVRMAISTRM